MTSSDAIALTPGGLSLDALRRIYRAPTPLSLPADARQRMADSRAMVETIAAGHTAVYGINTGFGKLAQKRIAPADLDTLQRNLILSHATGVGEPLDDGVVRLILACKIASLAVGASGIRPEVVEALLKLYHAGAMPVVPAKGSVGASGDLAPLAHLSGVLLGVGHIRINGETVDALEGLKRAGIQPIELKAKEGLALINGTQVSTALALAGLFEIERCFKAAIISGALSVEAVKGSHKPFDARISDLRGPAGPDRRCPRLSRPAGRQPAQRQPPGRKL